jgi:hypothetical protein
MDGGLTDEELLKDISATFEGCPYDVVQLAGLRLNEIKEFEQVLDGCSGKTLLGTFDVSQNVYGDIVDGRVSFGISQQEFLQGVLPVQLATLYVTTGKLPASPVGDNEGVYLSGPSVIDIDNVPSDTLQTCTDDAFPICPNTEDPFGQESACPCIDRSSIRIGGVVHGVTTDDFWDPVFAASKQAARDMGVELDMERFEPPDTGDSDAILHQRMANKIRSLCDRNVDGLFVSIPSNVVAKAVQYCLDLAIPVVSVNSGAGFSEELGLLHHVGQLEIRSWLCGRATSDRCRNHQGVVCEPRTRERSSGA